MNPETFRLILMLARVCISEGGFDGHEECTVIVHSLIEQAAYRNTTLEAQICAYSPNSCNRRRTDSRRWISFLHPERDTRPPGFPTRLPWTVYRAKVAAMVVTAYNAYQGVSVNACPGAFHWGSRHCGRCRRRMREYGFQRLPCPVGANHWWQRPIEAQPVPEPPETLMCEVLICSSLPHLMVSATMLDGHRIAMRNLPEAISRRWLE